MWNPLKLFETIDKGIDLASEVVEDPDKRNELNAMLSKVKTEATQAKAELDQQFDLAALQVKTVPWIDAIHKMQRGILSVLSMGITVYMVHKGVTDPVALLAGMAPSAGYNIVKGRGQ
jgi:hypothetical protein